MDVDYVSDLHYDHRGISQDSLLSTFLSDFNIVGEEVLTSKKGMWLVIAGDISSKPDDIVTLLSGLSTIYAHVLFVFGNHDLYLSSSELYLGATIDVRKGYIKKKLKDYPTVHVLDNDLVTVDGFTVYGTSNWYHLPDNYSRAWWVTMNNDSRYLGFNGKWSPSNELADRDFTLTTSTLTGITGTGSSKGVDLFISHVPPIHFTSNPFEENYCFYNSRLLDETFPLLNYNIPVWVCGHQHFKESILVPYGGSGYSTSVLSNPSGYESEGLPKILASFSLFSRN